MILALVVNVLVSNPLPVITDNRPVVVESIREVVPLVELPGLQCTDANRPYVQPNRQALYLEGGPTNEEAFLVEKSIDTCGQTNRRVADPFEILALFRLEKDLKLPIGILAASFCIEASMRTETAAKKPIRGDWQNYIAMSHGPFQLQKWFRDFCGLTESGADDLLTAATCYGSMMHYRYDKSLTLCGARVWQMSEAMSANGPKYNWGKGRRDPCGVQSKHWIQALKLPIPR